MTEEKAVAVDFDGTMNLYKNWGNGEVTNNPLPGTVEALKAFRDMGYKVIIYTCRTNPNVNGDAEVQYKMLQSWLYSNGLNFVEIALNGKPVAEFYIDDRGITFSNNWPEIVKAIAKKQHQCNNPKQTTEAKE